MKGGGVDFENENIEKNYKDSKLGIL